MKHFIIIALYHICSDRLGRTLNASSHLSKLSRSAKMPMDTTEFLTAQGWKGKGTGGHLSAARYSHRRGS